MNYREGRSVNISVQSCTAYSMQRLTKLVCKFTGRNRHLHCGNETAASTRSYLGGKKLLSVLAAGGGILARSQLVRIRLICKLTWCR